jgi:hypothetical protein
MNLKLEKSDLSFISIEKFLPQKKNFPHNNKSDHPQLPRVKSAKPDIPAAYY